MFHVDRWPKTFGVSCLLALVFLNACNDKGKARDALGGAPEAAPVQTVVLQPKKLAETAEYLALVKSRHSANINPQVEGYVTKILVKSGDQVKTGTPLLQIDPLKQEATLKSQEASRAAQEANVGLAKINLERAQKLADAGVISKADLDNAQTNYDTAVAQLKSLAEQVQQQRVELHYYSVTSPMDGIVGDIPVRLGDRVIVSTLLTTVDEPGALEAYIYVPAVRAKELKLGLPVRLQDYADGVHADTKITFVSAQVDPETQTILAKAAMGSAKTNLRTAQQVRAQITWGNREGLVVPILCVTRINGEFFVFLTVKETQGLVARQRLVKLGEMTGNDYAVLEGLKAGDHVIVSDTQFLQDGASVTEQNQADGPNKGKEEKPGAKTR
jgi:RND family efflux transporter MFP subunit